MSISEVFYRDLSSDEHFSNPVTAGFYLMGREIKRDVILDVFDTEGSLIFSDVTLEPYDHDAICLRFF